MKKILVLIAILLISGCTSDVYEKHGERLILKHWKLTYFPDGIDKGTETYYPEYSTLEKCKNAGLEKIKGEITEHPDADFFCGTNCIVVKDGVEPRHCENGVVAKCSDGKCEYLEVVDLDRGIDID